MKSLYILRHAKSDWGLNVSDFDRSLNNRGLKDAPMMGKILKKLGIKPEIILASPAKRAATTAKLVAETAEYKSEIKYIESFYPGSIHDTINALSVLNNTVTSALVVGHNPVMENLISYLCSSGRMAFTMPTASLVALDVYSDWNELSANDALFKWVLYPKFVNKILSTDYTD